VRQCTLQCVAMRAVGCDFPAVRQCAGVCGSVRQCGSGRQCGSVRGGVWQCTAMRQCVAVRAVVCEW
jgi:hypothetical protein